MRWNKSRKRPDRCDATGTATLANSPRRQQGPALLARQRLDMDRAEQVDRIIWAMPRQCGRIVRLASERPWCAGLDVDNRQPCFGQAAEQPLRQGPGFKPDPPPTGVDERVALAALELLSAL